MKKSKLNLVIFAVLFCVFGNVFLPVESNASGAEDLKICSFNIRNLGNFKEKENEALSEILKNYDIVAVQELIAPPFNGNYPDGKPYKVNKRAAAFFKCMEQKGFSNKLSEEDTGPVNKIHVNSIATEWWVVFYKPEAVDEVNDLPCGFLADDRSKNADYERVPYAFGFRTKDKHLDFVLISVHLKPDEGRLNRERRQHEINAIVQWIDKNNSEEKDFIILGDMNIQNKKEFSADVPDGYESLNKDCVQTNVKPTKKPSEIKPFDHVMYNPEFTTEIDGSQKLKIIDLIEDVRPYWDPNKGNFPGNLKNFKVNFFSKFYSDHKPIVFTMNIPEKDDD